MQFYIKGRLVQKDCILIAFSAALQYLVAAFFTPPFSLNGELWSIFHIIYISMIISMIEMVYGSVFLWELRGKDRRLGVPNLRFLRGGL